MVLHCSTWTRIWPEMCRAPHVWHKHTQTHWKWRTPRNLHSPSSLFQSFWLTQWFEWSKSSLSFRKRLIAGLSGSATLSFQSDGSVSQLRIRPLLWPSDISIHHRTACILLLPPLSWGTGCLVWHLVYTLQQMWRKRCMACYNMKYAMPLILWLICLGHCEKCCTNTFIWFLL